MHKVDLDNILGLEATSGEIVFKLCDIQATALVNRELLLRIYAKLYDLDLEVVTKDMQGLEEQYFENALDKVRKVLIPKG